ncbi:MAG TPA: VIT domain-containing protein [Candidatus Binatia bacterium]|nr:VIT domain-containing protein [Candidatus Binatia bacterium]
MKRNTNSTRLWVSVMTAAMIVGACSSAVQERADSRREAQQRPAQSDRTPPPAQSGAVHAPRRAAEPVPQALARPVAPAPAPPPAASSDDGVAYGQAETVTEYAEEADAGRAAPLSVQPHGGAGAALESKSKMAAGSVRGRRGDADTAVADLGAPRPGEELWIIARDDKRPSKHSRRDYPVLKAKRPNLAVEIPLPLQHTDVDARIAGYVATVSVKQRYENPYSEKIEAIYVFPLPEDAAVQDFVMTVGERRIRGIIRERQEAEKIYQVARSSGYTASLLTQERPNVFTQSVANIEPGKTIDIDLQYFHTVDLVDGEYEFVFPMVVGPRYNMPGAGDGIGAVAVGQHGASGQAVEIPYMDPEKERSGHDVSVAVEIEGGMKIESIHSPSHTVEATRSSDRLVKVALDRRDRIPNEDFVLRYKLAGETAKTAFLTHRDDRGGYFTLMLEPPASLAQSRRQPMELIFVLDCSGSMAGKPLEIAKSAAERALRKLRSDDTFQIISFSDSASALGPQPLRATTSNVRRGIEYLHALDSEGGTNMIEGMRAALAFDHDSQRMRVVSFMTDGFIGQDSDVLAVVQRHVGDARIFSLGVGSSVNRYLLERMAVLGRGAAAFVGIDESHAEAIDNFYERVSHAALTDIEIDWGGLDVRDVYPSRVPDLFVGRPVVVTGRIADDGGDATIRVRGRVAGKMEELQVTAGGEDRARPGIAAIWARTRITELEDDGRLHGQASAASEITQVALEHSLMSAYTAFVAVDSSARTAGDHGVTVVQPVPVPKGMSYQTTVR